MTLYKKIFLKIFACIFACFLIIASTSSFAATNLPMADVGDFGVWATENNFNLFTQELKNDLSQFEMGLENPQLVKDFVPIEAKLGLVFMNALSYIGEVLDISLVRFVIIFIIIAYTFWIMFETYNMMTKGQGNLVDFGKDLVWKGALIAIWLIILQFGPAQLFMYIMSPIISVGAYISDLILNSVSSVANTSLPDTCSAIAQYTAMHTSSRMLISPEYAADLLCIPTRLSGFFYTGVAVGWQWMIDSIGNSFLTFIVGLVFIGLFLYNIWKFAISAFGIIADLFLGVLLLPFTAISECVGKTSLKGIPGDIYNGFMGLFNGTESLSKQIQRFVNAMVYFVSLSIVISVCAILLSLTINIDPATSIPSLENNNFLTTLLIGCLTAYLVNKSSDIAKKIGGEINDSFGKKVVDDSTKLVKDFIKWGKEISKTIKEDKK